MKVYRVLFRDRWDVFGYTDYSNREAAEQNVKWHRDHPTPEDEMGWFEIKEVEINIDEVFVPPMSDEEYHQKYDSYLRAIVEDTDDDPYDDPLM